MYKKKSGKKLTWKIGCTVFILLLFCMIVSIRIQSMMRIEVRLTKGEIQKETGEMLLPLSCIAWTEYGQPVVYLLQEEEGIFEKEWRIVEQSVTYYGEENGKARISAENLRNELGGYQSAVYYSSHPIQAGDVVVKEK